MTLQGKKILVTGGCGFMGSNFIRHILSRVSGATVINVDALTYAANPDNLKGIDKSRYEFLKGDITDAKLTKKIMKRANIVVNFAAETHVDRSIHTNGSKFVHSNVQGVHVLMEALRASPHIEKFVHISTDEVWGDLPLSSKKKFNEKSQFAPNSLYAATKAAGDLVVRAYIRTHQLPAIVTHSVNNYGPDQHPEKLIPFFTMRAMRDMPLPLYGDGRNMRDWLYVEDHSDALLTVLQKGVVGEVYAISSGDTYTNKVIAERILKSLGKPRSLISYTADRPGHDRKYAVDSSKLRKLGWRPRFSVEEKLPGAVRTIAKRDRAGIDGVNAHIEL